MTAEYNHLMSLKMSEGYKVLQALWAHQHGKIVEAMRKAGKKGNETSWRYFAGQNEGFELAITQVERALEDMQKTMENENPQADPSRDIEELLNNLKEKKNGA